MVYAFSITNIWNCTIVLTYHSQNYNTSFFLRLMIMCTGKIPLMWSQIAHSLWHFNDFDALTISYNIFSFTWFPWLFTKVYLWDIALLSLIMLMSLNHCVPVIMLIVRKMFTFEQWVYAFLPPASAVEVIESEPSFCVSVCVCVCVNTLTAKPYLGWDCAYLCPSCQKDYRAKGLCMRRTREVSQHSGVFCR